jgi:hypothetical protein
MQGWSKPEIEPHNYSHLIFDIEAKDTQGRKESSSTNGARKTAIYMQKTETRPLSLYTNQL